MLFRLLAVLVLTFTVVANADEGMWTYDNKPVLRKLLKDRYHFEPSDTWLDSLMKASVRFNSGGSGSFVSADGLVLTNHHVGADTLEKLSTPQHNYIRDGFYAPTKDKEIKAKDLELNVLQTILDVTARVNAAVQPTMTAEQQVLARRAEIARIEKESETQTGLRSNVVTLYQGGQYHLYRFKRYTDVRVVFAPEKSIAFFGGDPDNFEYPRYDLDMAIFRAYENGQPVRPTNYLKWSARGPQDGELSFVSGHPGRTSRLFTLAAFEYLRDFGVPYALERLLRVEASLKEFSAKGEEQARRAEGELFYAQNSRKVYVGRHKALQEGKIVADKAKRETELRDAAKKAPSLKELLGAWDAIAATRVKARGLYLPYNMLEAGQGFNSTLFNVARTLVRLADENVKADTVRLPEYQDARRPELEQALYSEAPVFADLEEWKLAEGLSFLSDKLGATHPAVVKALAGKSPKDRAADIVKGTKLLDVAYRRTVAKGGQAAIAASTDPMIVLAKSVDADARALRKTFEQEIDEPEKQAYAQISKMIFSLYGTSQYPDATFTLRLSFGTVKGYELEKQVVPSMTTLGGAFAHEAAHGAVEPWKLPASWHAAKPTLALGTSYNFVSTNDIIGGNSGSPVVNKNQELIGLIFDGNAQSLTSDYIYDDVVSRAVSVSTAAMTEAMKKIYKADALVAELLAKKRRR